MTSVGGNEYLQDFISSLFGSIQA